MVRDVGESCGKRLRTGVSRCSASLHKEIGSGDFAELLRMWVVGRNVVVRILAWRGEDLQHGQRDEQLFDDPSMQRNSSSTSGLVPGTPSSPMKTGFLMLLAARATRTIRLVSSP